MDHILEHLNLPPHDHLFCSEVAVSARMCVSNFETENFNGLFHGALKMVKNASIKAL